MAKEIEIQLPKKVAEELADLDLSLGLITKKDYNKKVELHMRPIKVLYG